MDPKRVALAVAISLLIMLGYQHFFVTPGLEQQRIAQEQAAQDAQNNPPAAQQQANSTSVSTLPIQTGSQTTQPVEVNRDARKITVDTPLYTAIVNEQGGGFASFTLKNYREERDEESGPMQLVMTSQPQNLPILFSLDNGKSIISLFQAAQDTLTLTGSGEVKTLEMKAQTANGTVITRRLTFRSDSYLIDDNYSVTNESGNVIQLSPAMTMVNEPFTHVKSTQQFLFVGPAAYLNGELVETKVKELNKKGPQTLQGQVSWTGFTSNYFMTAVVPKSSPQNSISLATTGEERVQTILSSGLTSLDPQQTLDCNYQLYFGPKKLKILEDTGDELEKAVNFGWFDILAKPMLWLLNFFYEFTGNYGVAIILVTILIKLCFWPVTQKGMKSMKNMQKLQPKMAKLREKYKDNPQQLNQEMMAMYKTYKVNPIGGCLPMLIQIPFFFALYRVLMAAIELRHAPFMLWINDLSAPDRLWIGFDIPYLHGLPVLTLLMGASMYLQQKMTPTTADPTQARIMQFLPVIFTVMFVNFASGLVLYWFVNNLLSILQQQLINRKSKA